MLHKIWRHFLVIGISVCLIGCSGLATNQETQVAQLNQGWSKQEIEFYNHASEGTNLAPIEFVVNLPDPANPNSKFVEKLDTDYGFIPGETSELNPYQLPVGFAIDKRPQLLGDRAYLGVTCATCHTRQLKYSKTDSLGNQSDWILPVHGGPSLADFPRFQDDLYNAFFALLQDDTLMEKFATDVLQNVPQPEDIESLRNEIREIVGPFAATKQVIEALEVPVADFGYGNLNALTLGNYNNVGLVAWLTKKGILEPSEEPLLRIKFEGAVNYPPMWYAPHDTWAQWFVEIHHPGTRNWVQSTSTSPVRPPKVIEAAGQGAILASIHYDNIEKIQESLERLRTPQWPEAVLGTLNQDLIAQGKPLFEENCAQCHVRTTELPNELGLKFQERVAFDVGTDPVAYEQFAEHASERAKGLIGLSDKMLAMRKNQLIQQFGEDAAANYVKHDSRGRPNLFALAQENEYDYGESLDSTEKSGGVYWASPMEGIFASSPYFHNGSVPSLWDVLATPEERPLTFQTGGNEFDPEHVGLTNEGPFVYDTQEDGKGNGGHLFGTQLPPDQKIALIEYLKSL